MPKNNLIKYEKLEESILKIIRQVEIISMQVLLKDLRKEYKDICWMTVNNYLLILEKKKLVSPIRVGRFTVWKLTK